MRLFIKIMYRLRLNLKTTPPSGFWMENDLLLICFLLKRMCYAVQKSNE